MQFLHPSSLVRFRPHLAYITSRSFVALSHCYISNKVSRLHIFVFIGCISVEISNVGDMHTLTYPKLLPMTVVLSYRFSFCIFLFCVLVNVCTFCGFCERSLGRCRLSLVSLQVQKSCLKCIQNNLLRDIKPMTHSFVRHLFHFEKSDNVYLSVVFLAF